MYIKNLVLIFLILSLHACSQQTQKSTDQPNTINQPDTLNNGTIN